MRIRPLAALIPLSLALAAAPAFAEENIDNTAAFLGLDNFLTEATLHEVISRRNMLFREVLREQRRQMETGAYDADRLATVSEHNSSWSTSRAFIIAKIHSVKR